MNFILIMMIVVYTGIFGFQLYEFSVNIYNIKVHGDTTIFCDGVERKPYTITECIITIAIDIAMVIISVLILGHFNFI